MEHPGLTIGVELFLHQLLLQVRDSAIDDAAADADAGVASERQTPDDVGGHVVIAPAVLPPSPAAVAVLEVVEARQACAGHLVELLEILLSLRMSLVGVLLLDAAEEPRGDDFARYAEVGEGFRDDDGGEEAGHRLLGAAVGIVDEVRKRV